MIDMEKSELRAAAAQSIDRISSQMLIENQMLMREHAGSDFPAYLWPFSVWIEAVSASVRAGLADNTLRRFYKQCLDEILPKYQDSRRNDYRVYNSTTDGGDPFYDDNAWIALEFVRASELFPDEHEIYLTLARETAAYCFSGEDEKLGGGIYWKEKECNSKNTCINAPAAILACELYRVTAEPYYLARAKALYAFTRQYLFDSETGTYHDSIDADSARVDTAKYTYNSGTMISAGAMLYQITGNDVYLHDAQCTTAGAYHRFGEETSDGGYNFKSDHPWFNSWLLNGYCALAAVDPRTSPKYKGSFVSALLTCIRNPRPDGFWNRHWTKCASDDKPAALIDQSGTLKCIATLLGS